MTKFNPGIPALPARVACVFLSTVPRSPHWRKGRTAALPKPAAQERLTRIIAAKVPDYLLRFVLREARKLAPTAS